MKNTNITIKHIAFLFILIFSFSACETDFTSIDSDLINSDTNNFETSSMSYPVITHTKTLSPFASYQMTSNLLGYYNSNIFGSSTANVVAQVTASQFNPVFGGQVAIDSVVLTIPYFSRITEYDENGIPTYELDSILGSNPIKLSVYKNNYFLRDFDPDAEFEDNLIYYSDKSTSNGEMISDADLQAQQIYYNEAFTTSSDQIILTNNEEPEDEEDDSNITATLAPSLRIRLDNLDESENQHTLTPNFWENLIFDLEGQPELSNQNNFQNHFRGLYFKAEVNDENGSMMLLNFRNPASTIICYYKIERTNDDADMDGIPDFADVDVNGDGVNDNGLDTDNDGINDVYDVNSTGGEDIDNDGIDDTEGGPTKNFTMNFTGNVVNFLENDGFNVSDGDEVNGDEQLFLKGGLGSMAVINLFEGDEEGNSPVLEDFRTNNWLINEAQLVFHVDESQPNNDEPLRLFIYDLENKRPVVDYFFDQSIDTDSNQNKINHLVPLETVDDEPNGQGIKYKVRITEHINNILQNDSTNVKLGLFVSSNINEYNSFRLKDYDENNSDFQIQDIASGTAASPKGTVLHGSNSPNPDKQVFLEIFYTEPNED